MSSLLLLFLCIIPHLSADEGVGQPNCTMPVHPKNGGYKIIKPDNEPSMRPGDKVHMYHVQLYCDEGFKSNRSRESFHTCLNGVTNLSDFHCFPICTRKYDNLLSCGSDAYCIHEPEQCKQPDPMQPDSVQPEPIKTYYTSSLSSDDKVQEINEECGSLGVNQRRRHQSQNASETSKEMFTQVSYGEDADIAELPWHSAIYTKKTKPYMQICGGTLITHTVVISAAHCFWNEVEKQLPASQFAVAVGKLYRPWNDTHDQNAQKCDVEEIRIPPHFQGHVTHLQDDVALVIATSSFTFTKFVRPACLNFDLSMDRTQLAPYSLGKVAGWGLTSEDGPPSPILKTALLPIVDIRQCFEQSDPGFRSYITSDKICAGWENGTAVCRGDSGEGLVFPFWSTGRIHHYIRGVVSGASQNEHRCNVYTWASFTHLLRHEHFIMETLQEISGEAANTDPESSP